MQHARTHTRISQSLWILCNNEGLPANLGLIRGLFNNSVKLQDFIVTNSIGR
jgi:hypothetical protein